MVDTNSDPNLVDFPIPSNDDASKSIDIILSCVAATIQEAMDERATEKKSKDVQDSKAQKKSKKS
jgi:small subunit ribosomal protein S2